MTQTTLIIFNVKRKRIKKCHIRIFQTQLVRIFFPRHNKKFIYYMTQLRKWIFALYADDNLLYDDNTLSKNTRIYRQLIITIVLLNGRVVVLLSKSFHHIVIFDGGKGPGSS